MAARTPRRSFATPFVVTLAAAPACYTGSNEPAPSQPEPARTIVVANPPRPTAEPEPAPRPVNVNPPPPSTAPNPPPPRQDSWHVFHDKDGCTAILDVQCPQGATCNPPAPTPYACPPGLQVSQSVKVITFGAGCVIEPAPVSCPPQTMCNPPRPQPVACPK